MARRTKRGDPIENEMELALRPGEFIRDHACFSFVSGLEEVAAKIEALIRTDAARAAGLYETFFAGCHAKAEEHHDSGGSFGQFAQHLICQWIKARQTAGADPNETAATFLAWMDDDPYAFCYQIERDVTKAFDKAGRVAFEKLARARFEAAPLQPEYNRRRWGTVLRAVYLAQRKVAAYEALAQETGLTAQDCLALAAIFVSGKPGQALEWVERGIDLDRNTPHGSAAGYDLARLQRELLTKLGRGNEALDAAWAEYAKNPSKYTYADVMQFVPKGQRAAWHEKAMEAAKGADLHSAMDLFVEAKEMERLADLVRGVTDQALVHVSHYATEPAAMKLEKTQPGLAARLWRAQGMRIVDAGKSKYYEAAISNFERAKRCYVRAGLAAEWEETVRQVRYSHRRKTGFMPAFESIATGAGPKEQPSFLERAKARWGGKRTGDSA
jgi:hypothetical protein